MPTSSLALQDQALKAFRWQELRRVRGSHEHRAALTLGLSFMLLT